jgi:hypothetical protein
VTAPGAPPDPDRGTGTVLRTALLILAIFAVAAALSLYGLTR